MQARTLPARRSRAARRRPAAPSSTTRPGSSRRIDPPGRERWRGQVHEAYEVPIRIGDDGVFPSWDTSIVPPRSEAARRPGSSSRQVGAPNGTGLSGMAERRCTPRTQPRPDDGVMSARHAPPPSRGDPIDAPASSWPGLANEHAVSHDAVHALYMEKHS